MDVKTFADILGCDFFCGVPDSQLRALCDWLIDTYGTDPVHHIIAANEGNAASIASGYHLATRKTPVVYMQNSGLGNIINPSASLLNPKVYDIPAIYIIGWRGEPGIHDEPQHIYQGAVTLTLLEDMGIKYIILSKDTSPEELSHFINSTQGQRAIVVRKGALTYGKIRKYLHNFVMIREEIIRHIISFSGDSPIISTTGKTSRELFELREDHSRDFLTVGSMGHASSIALGVALNFPRKVWCIDGDGAALMHMGSLAVIGTIRPKNLVHVVINNSAHESVGGLPTCAGSIDLPGIAKACGYVHVYSVNDYDGLDEALSSARDNDGLTFIEAKCKIYSREDLGRPTTTALENKSAFMDYITRQIS